MAKGFDNPPPPPGGDKGHTPHDGGDKGADKSLINHIRDGKAEAPKAPETAVEKIEKEIAATTKALEESVTRVAAMMKSIADKNFHPDHEFHPNNILKAATIDHPEGSPADKLQKNLHLAVKGEIPANQVLSA